MKLLASTCSVLVLLLLTVAAAPAQDAQPWRPSNPTNPPQYQTPSTQPQPAHSQPYGPPTQGAPNSAMPRNSAAQVRPMNHQPAQRQAAPAPRTPPWAGRLPEAHQKRVDEILKAWEQYGNRVEVFESKFVLREFKTPMFRTEQSAAGTPTFEELGELKYKKPDKGLLRTDGIMNPKTKTWDVLPRHWVCDGEAIFEFDHKEKRLTQHVLDPKLRGGKALEDGPVPFVFGAKAEKMKNRYWIRLLSPPPGVQGQIWLEAWPRHHEDAAEFSRAEIILSAQDMRPIGLQLHAHDQTVRSRDGQVVVLPGDRKSYTFFDTVINPKSLLDFLKDDPFHPRKPFGWTKVVEPPKTARTGQPASGATRR
ncbi:MAG: hypothetical protein JW888_08645 [Pirellulales bacterium]|nr:hypothetical protein [Pirellulales bacterium]